MGRRTAGPDVLEDYLRGIVLPEEAHEHAVEHGDWPTALLTARPSQRLDVLAVSYTHLTLPTKRIV